MTPVRRLFPRLTRARSLGCLLVGAGVLVGLRLGELTIIEHKTLATLTRAQVQDTVQIPGPRGDIVDRRGRLLATSVPVKVLAVEPREMTRAGLLAVERAAGVPGRLAHRGSARWFLVRRDCGESVVTAVESLVRQGVVSKDAIHWAPGFKRHYPQGPSAAHVLGFVTLDESLAEGVEKTYDGLLRSGEVRVLRATDGRGDTLGSLAGSPYPAASSSLMLTIDLRLQQALERALATAVEEHGAKAAQGIVLDPTNGEVLAMAVHPAYDPNTFNRDDPALHRNSAIELPFEPGSVMKPLTAAALAEYKTINDYEQVYCENGHWRRGKWTISDLHPYGWLTMPLVIAKSSNIGMAKFASRLAPQQLYDGLAALGLGRRTGIDLPAENAGALPNFRTWRGPTRDVLAFGHSLTLTTLQLATAYGTIANGGERVRPFVGRAWGSPDGEWHTTPRTAPVRAMSPRAAAQVALWMLGVVESEGGTGRRAAVSGFRVAGKTGTAEKITDGRYDSTRNIATFAGFAPVATPAAVVVISVDEPHAGGRTGGVAAAPAFAQVMEETLRLLRVPPDYIPEPPPEPVQRTSNEPPSSAEPSPAPSSAASAAPASPARRARRG